MTRIAIFILFGVVCNLQAQDSILYNQFETVNIEATRIKTQKLQSPIPVSKLQVNPLFSSNQNSGINAYLNQIPGVFALNQNNSAQDLRISIRGFGARSAFGIRGIKMIVDEVPITTPDGQGQVDNILVSGIRNMEVLRGPSSAFYGNASGGVIQINSFEDTEKDHHSVRLGAGSFNNYYLSLDHQKSFADTKLNLKASLSAKEGYRQHSSSSNALLNGKISRRIGKHQIDYLISYLNSPKGEDPGGVNIESVEMDRRAARDRNISFDAGEKITQFSNAFKYNFSISKDLDFKTISYFSNRDFTGKLPFENGGGVELNRNYGGIISNIDYRFSQNGWDHNLIIGLELAHQNDHRIRYVNDDGVFGEETLNQNEVFSNLAIFATFQSRFDKFLFQAGLRRDENRISAKDHFMVDGDDSGSLRLPNLSPSFSWSYNIKADHFLYASASYGFETPTLSELTSNPNNTGGLNQDLKAQQAFNYDFGYKAVLRKRIELGISFFAVNSKSELIPYEIASFPGRTFYRNAGRTNRQGIELEMLWKPNANFQLRTAYSAGSFVFTDFIVDGNDFSGNKLQGIPEHNLFLNLSYSQNKLGFAWTNRYISSIFLTTDNRVKDNPYLVGALQATYRVKLAKLVFMPNFGIDNLYNVKYNDNIRTNAFGGRYYEPAPGINFYFGLKFDF